MKYKIRNKKELIIKKENLTIVKRGEHIVINTRMVAREIKVSKYHR